MRALLTRRRTVLAFALLLLLLLGSAGYWAGRPAAEAAVAAVRPDPAAERFVAIDAEYKRTYHSLSRDDQFKATAAHRAELAKLPDDQQRAYRRAELDASFQRHEEMLLRYHAMTPEQKRAYMDHEIDEDEAAIKRTEARLAARKATGKPVPALRPTPGPLPEDAAKGVPVSPEIKAIQFNFIRDRKARRIERGLPVRND